MQDLIRRRDVEWEIPREGAMLVPGIVFATERMLQAADTSEALQQVRNVAHLPGIVEASMAMPDIHWGYGFPIGGVAATDVDEGGVVSPGGVGFDICCGVRLLASGFTASEFAERREAVMRELDRRIPRGTGVGAIAGGGLLDDVLIRGARAAVAAGFGVPADLERCEDRGVWPEADPGAISDRARERGSGQLGSLGGGNHFLEVQIVDEVVDPVAAEAFGLRTGMVCVMIHCGSRGLGHQVCTDELALMGRAMARHRIRVPDRQLACVPVASTEGESYLGAMGAAANFAWANRQVLTHEVRRAFAVAFGSDADRIGMELVYDVAHNLARIEDHDLGGSRRRLCVHRKGATRALGPGDRDLIGVYRSVGQPVLVPGSMGTASWVMKGTQANPAFSSAAHGAGRVMSRHAALRHRTGDQVKRELEGSGISVRPGSVRLLAEEAPYAYKDIDEVVAVCKGAGLASPVARMRPVGVVKG